MSEPLLLELDKRIQAALELIELSRIQIDELEHKNAQLKHENAALKSRHSDWEQNIGHLLRKLDNIEGGSEIPHVGQHAEVLEGI